jgi:hypothetical protein
VCQMIAGGNWWRANKTSSFVISAAKLKHAPLAVRASQLIAPDPTPRCCRRCPATAYCGSVDGLSDYYDPAELRKYRNTAVYRVGIPRRL